MAAKPDFRDEAAAASEVVLAEAPGRDPLLAGASLCAAVYPDGPPRSVNPLTKLIVGLVLLGGGVTMIVVSFEGGKVVNPLLLGAGIAVVLGMLISGSLIMTMLKRRTRARIVGPMRPGQPVINLNEIDEAIFVLIENGNTYRRAKVIPEDRGFLVIDRENRRLQVEGDLYRYVIRAQDVQDLRFTQAMTIGAIDVVYQVGAVELRLAIYHLGSNISWKSMSVTSRMLYDMIEDALLPPPD